MTAPLDHGNPPPEELGRRGGQTLTALLSGATALANKVRVEAPKKIHEAREKRVRGCHVILTEIDGRTVAIGPYPDGLAALEDSDRVAVASKAVELLSPAAYFGAEDSV